MPPDQTNAENFYYVKQMQSKTPMVFVLRDGETLHGVIEWYDKMLPEGEPHRRAEPAALQAQHQVHVQGVGPAWLAYRVRFRIRQPVFPVVSPASR